MRLFRGALGLVLVTFASWLMAGSAFAAFPGSDGLLAVQPVTGAGFELVSPGGMGAHRVCSAGPRCLRVRHPSWSPNGRALVFSSRGGLKAIYPDGTCLDCQFGGAVDPAFRPDGTEVSFVLGRDVLVDGIDAIRKSSGAVGVGSDPVWSVRGDLALSRSGRVWAGTVGHLRDIGLGTEPSWSPNGTEVAAAHAGWILLESLTGGPARRLVRGTAPAFSPDGHSVAFIGAGHQVMIARTGAHPNPRSVSGVTGDSVDWQPKPSSVIGTCQPPPGSRVAAKPAGALVTVDDDKLGSEALMGCLISEGHEYLLSLDPPGNVDSSDGTAVGPVALPYLGLIYNSTDPHYGGYVESLGVVDLRTGQFPNTAETISCSNGCPQLRDLAVSSSTGATAGDVWATDSPGDLANPLTAVSCTTDGLCATINDVSSQAFSSMAPSAGAGAWQAAALLPPAGLTSQTPSGVACPTSSLCVSVGDSTVWTDQNNTGWVATVIAGTPKLDGVSCPSVSLCVATGATGQIAVSTDPAAGGSSWQSQLAVAHNRVEDPVCAPDGTCSVMTNDPYVSYQNDEEVYSSTDPAAGPSSWHQDVGVPNYTSASCPTNDFCASADGSEMSVSSAPGTAPTATFRQNQLLNAISCSSASFCAAVGSSGLLETSTSPQTGQWTPITIDQDTLGTGRTLNAIDCPTDSSCVVTDQNGHAVTSSDPTGGPGAWSAALIDGAGCDDTQDCSNEQIIANLGHGSHTIATANTPGTGPYVQHLQFSATSLSWTQNGTPETALLTP